MVAPGRTMRAHHVTAFLGDGRLTTGAAAARWAQRGLPGLERLRALRRLTMAWGLLRELPPQLSALTALEAVDLAGEPLLRVAAAGELWGLLERLPTLARLALGPRACEELPVAELGSLCDAFPRVELVLAAPLDQGELGWGGGGEGEGDQWEEEEEEEEEEGEQWEEEEKEEEEEEGSDGSEWEEEEGDEDGEEE
eukprot:scaffold14.g1167.t1